MIVTRFEEYLEQTGRCKIIASFSQEILPQIAESAVVSVQFLTHFDLWHYSHWKLNFWMKRCHSEMCWKKVEQEEEVPREILKVWKRWLYGTKYVSRVKIDRYYHDFCWQCSDIQLHIVTYFLSKIFLWKMD